MDKQQLVLELFKIGVLQFGSFTLKSGLQSPFYLDFRRIVAYPKILRAISENLWSLAQDLPCDHLCGVPYAALSISSTMATLYEKPMIVKRKEQKKHGTKRLVEGIYKKGDECIVMDDVISSGISMIETLEALQGEGLVTRHIMAIVDRMQGGSVALREHGYQVHSLYTMKEVLDILFDAQKITQENYDDTVNFIRNNQINFQQLRLKSPIRQAFNNFDFLLEKAQHPAAKRLLGIIKSKETNLCCSADVDTAEELLDLADKVGPHICMLKTHIDTLTDFDETVPQRLRALADKHQFLILEDRKFADIGHIAARQFTAKPFAISDWADAVTVHVVAGASGIEALKTTGKMDNVGVFVVAEMSTQDTLAIKDYTQKALTIAQKQNDVVLGVIAQQYRPQTSGLLVCTPGVHLEASADGLGQKYNHPTRAIAQRGVDIIIVGRGIHRAEDPAAKALAYKQVAWEGYLKRLD